jgi:hypothetical protein
LRFAVLLADDYHSVVVAFHLVQPVGAGRHLGRFGGPDHRTGRGDRDPTIRDYFLKKTRAMRYPMYGERSGRVYIQIYIPKMQLNDLQR